MQVINNRGRGRLPCLEGDAAHRKTAGRGHRQRLGLPPYGRLADVGRQFFIRRLELGPPRVGVAPVTTGDVGGEIFNMDLDPRPVGG
jgi:hypothetical protein